MACGSRLTGSRGFKERAGHKSPARSPIIQVMDASPPPAFVRPHSPTHSAGQGARPPDVELARLRDRGEARHLGPGGTPRLVRVARGGPDAKPIVFIHGFTGDPANQAAMIKEARTRGMEVWVMAYDTVEKPLVANAEGFAGELAKLAASGRRDLTIVAHSLGALTLKAGFAVLDARPEGLPFQRLRVVAISTPWRGLRVADWAGGAFGKDALPPLMRDLAPTGPTMRALSSRPWPAGVAFDDLVGSRDPVRWIEARPATGAPTSGRRRVVIAGASHNTVLWDPRTVAYVFEGPPGTTTSAPRPDLWRTILDESAAVMGLPGAFER